MGKYLDTYTCYFQNSDTEKQFTSLKETMQAASLYVGNNRYNKVFSGEATAYLYGPGDGLTSVIIRRDYDFIHK